MDLQDLKATIQIGQLKDVNAHSIRARDLYKFLEIKSEFGIWFTNTKIQSKVKSHIDFIPFKYTSPKGRGAQSQDYHLTIEAALRFSKRYDNPIHRIAVQLFTEMLPKVDVEVEVEKEEEPEVKKETSLALLKIQTMVMGKGKNKSKVNSLNARDLHQFLEVKKDFSDWIKGRILKYDFVEGIDFIPFPQIGERAIGGATLIEYAVTLDMAKELAMVERNDRGKEARQYFIECERIKKELENLSQVKIPDFTNPSEAARAWADSFDRTVYALKERDEAIKERSLISDKKTATAMAKSALLTKENARLKKTIDLMQYRYMSELHWLHRYFKGTDLKVIYRRVEEHLIKLSGTMGYEIITRSKSNKNAPSLYHRDVINKFREILDERGLQVAD